MISKFAHLPRQHQTNHEHHHHHHHQHHQHNHKHHNGNMNIPNNFDPVKVNNNSNMNNHSLTDREVELMMELPPSSPMSAGSHGTFHRSVSQANNGNGHVGHAASRLTSTADDLTQKPSQSVSFSRATLTSKEFGAEKSLPALGILALIAIILSALSIGLLIQFNTLQKQELTDDSMVGVAGSRWYADILDSGVVLASFCLTLNLCCVVVCTGQSYFAAKMLKLPQGEERSFEFLKNTAGCRFLAVCSFFVSIPIFLVALCLFILLEFRTIPASVSTALIGLAVLFMLFSFGHNVHLWRCEQSEISRRHAPPPTVFAGMMNGGIPGHHHHHATGGLHHADTGGFADDGDGHRFAYNNHVADDGVDPLSVSNLSTLV